MTSCLDVRSHRVMYSCVKVKMKIIYSILPIIVTPLNRGAPIVWRTKYCNEGLKEAYFP